MENCYRLIGFPADFKFTKNKRFPARPKNNVVLTTDDNAGQPMNAGDKPMTQDQFHNLYQLLQHVKVGTQNEQVTEDIVAANCVGIPISVLTPTSLLLSLNSLSWMLDSGASEHMTSDLSLLFNVKTLPKPLFVKLPNSLKVLVKQAGCVTIIPGFTLQHVLFVPSFKFNLLSVHKLCK